MAHSYLTYFDAIYLFRGLAMLHSLLRNDPDSTITVVCLDAETFRLFAMLDIAGVQPVPFAGIEAGYPELRKARSNRSQLEYYWTLTPLLLLHFLERMEPDQILTYLDADLFFFSSPEPIFAEMGDAAVLIHRHNFSRDYREDAKNGEYNVGWMSFRNNAEGIKVLSWWRERCLEWCFDRCEDGKIGDQGYLASFAAMTDSLVIASNPGIGVALWNVQNYVLSQHDDVPFVDEYPCIFFHFHSTGYVCEGMLLPAINIHYKCSLEMLLFCALPYLNALDAAYAEITHLKSGFLKGLTPPDVIKLTRLLVAHIRYLQDLQSTYPCIMLLNKEYFLGVSPQLLDQTKICGPTIMSGDLIWSGTYPDWQSAQMIAGNYDDQEIFKRCRDAARAVRDGKALWERDSCLFQKPEINWHVMTGLLATALRNHGELHVLDFGGAFGSTWWQHRQMLAAITKQCTWHVVEQAHFVKCGQEEFANTTLAFHYTIEEALAAAPINTILLGSVLQYLESPRPLIRKLAATGITLIIDRTPFLPEGERICIQRVPERIYPASYPCRWLDQRWLTWVLQKAGYTLSPWYDCDDAPGFKGVIAWKDCPK